MACNTGTGHGFYISGSQGTKSSGGTPYITHYNYKIQGGEEVMPGSGFDQIMELVCSVVKLSYGLNAIWVFEEKYCGLNAR